MTDHNPYVGIQRTVFEQGWTRGRKALLKAIKDEPERLVRYCEPGLNDDGEPRVIVDVLGIISEFEDA